MVGGLLQQGAWSFKHRTRSAGGPSLISGKPIIAAGVRVMAWIAAAASGQRGRYYWAWPYPDRIVNLLMGQQLVGMLHDALHLFCQTGFRPKI